MLLLSAAASLLSVPALATRDFNHYHREQQARSLRVIEEAASKAQFDKRSQGNYRYYNDQTKPYFIEKWPLVEFDTGEFYSGQLPIDESDVSKVTKKLLAWTSTDCFVCTSLRGSYSSSSNLRSMLPAII